MGSRLLSPVNRSESLRADAGHFAVDLRSNQNCPRRWRVAAAHPKPSGRLTLTSQWMVRGRWTRGLPCEHQACRSSPRRRPRWPVLVSCSRSRDCSGSLRTGWVAASGRELGIRRAVGASHGSIVWWFGRTWVGLLRPAILVGLAMQVVVLRVASASVQGLCPATVEELTAGVALVPYRVPLRRPSRFAGRSASTRNCWFDRPWPQRQWLLSAKREN